MPYTLGTIFSCGSPQTSYVTNGVLGDGTTSNRATLTSIGIVNARAVGGAVANGYYFDENNHLYGWGNNGSGSVGDGTTTDRSTPVLVNNTIDWDKFISTGSLINDDFVDALCFYGAIDSDGYLYMWGANTYGQLGLGDTTNRSTPTKVGTKTWSMVCRGSYHTVGIDTDGKLWGWGRNDFQQLGTGNTTSQTSPVQIGSASNWTFCSGGFAGIGAVNSSGEIYVIGYNGGYAFGTGTNTSPLTTLTKIGTATDWTESHIGQEFHIAKKTNGDLYRAGSRNNRRNSATTTSGTDTALTLSMQVNNTKVSLFDVGGWILTSDNKIYNWGLDTSGQLARGSTTSNRNPGYADNSSDGWIDIASLGRTYIALKENISASATINSESTISCNATVIEGGITHEGAADLSANATVSISADKIKTFSSSLTSECQTQIVIGIIKQFTCDFGALFTPTVQATGFKNHDASLTSDFTVIVTGIATRDISSTLDNIINLSSQGDRIRFVDSIQTSEFTKTIDAAVVISTEATIADSFAFNADVGKILGTNANLNSANELNSTIGVIKQFVCDFGALFTPAVDVEAIVNSDSIMNSAFAIAVSAEAIRQTEITLELDFTTTTVGDKIINTNVQLEISFAVVSNVDRTRFVDSQSNIQFDIVVSGVANKTFESTQSIESEINSIIDVTRNVNADLNAALEMSTLETRILQFSCDFGSLFTPTVNAVAIINSVSVIDSAFTVTITGDRSRAVESIQENNFAIIVQEERIRNAASIIASEFTQISTVDKLKIVSSSFASEFISSANAIEYIRRPNPYNRPIDLINIAGSYSTTRYEGNYSLNVGNAESPITNAFAFASNEDFMIEFAVRFSNGSAFNSPARVLWYGLWGDNNELSWSIARTGTTGNPSTTTGWQFRFWNGSQFVTATETASSYATNTWHLITVKRVNGIVSLETLASSTTRTTQSYSGAFRLPSSAYRFIDLEGGEFFSGGLLVDRLRFVRGGNSFVNSTDTTTVSEYLFEQNALDNWRQTFIGDAAITSTATSTINANYIADHSADVSSEFSIASISNYIAGHSADIVSQTSIQLEPLRIKSLASDISAEFTTVAVGDRIRFGEITTVAEFATSAEPVRIQQLASDINSEFSTVATGLRILPFAALLPVIATQLSAVSKIGDFLIASDVYADLQATPVVQRFGISTQSSEFTISVTGLRIQESSANLSVEFTQTATANFRVDPTIATLSEFTAQAIANRTRDLSATISSEFAVQSSASGIIPLISTVLQSQFSLTIAPFKIIQFAGTTNSEFSLTASGIKAVEADCSMAMEFSIANLAEITRNFAADLPVIATSLNSVAKIGDFLIASDVYADLSINPSAISSANSILSGSFNQSADINTIASGSIVSVSEFALGIDAVVGVVAQGTLASEFNQSTQINKIGSAEIAINTSFAISTTGTVQRSALAICSSTVETNTQPTRILQFDIDFGALFTPVMQFGLIADGAASFSATTAMTVQGRIIAINQQIYTIPRETRIYKISNENRSHTLRKELRMYTIEGN